MRSYRLIILCFAWLSHIALTIIAFPFVGESIMLMSILLCGVTTWLYSYKAGFITLLLTHPYHVFAMIYNLQDIEGWRIALSPGGFTVGIIAQLCAVSFVTVIKSNEQKVKEITMGLEEDIDKRNIELHKLATYITLSSEKKRIQMSDSLFTLVHNQQSELFTHSKELHAHLSAMGVEQADVAAKLVQLARENVEQIKSLRDRLSPQRIAEQGIGPALKEVCDHYRESKEVEFKISFSDHLEDLPEDISVNLYRIAYEGITNALRHGKAEKIELSITQTDMYCTLEVVNDGLPLPDDLEKGLGTRLIQHRADTINAEASLEPTVNGKTRLICKVPLSPPLSQGPESNGYAETS